MSVTDQQTSTSPLHANKAPRTVDFAGPLALHAKNSALNRDDGTREKRGAGGRGEAQGFVIGGGNLPVQASEKKNLPVQASGSDVYAEQSCPQIA